MKLRNKSYVYIIKPTAGQKDEFWFGSIFKIRSEKFFNKIIYEFYRKQNIHVLFFDRSSRT